MSPLYLLLIQLYNVTSSDYDLPMAPQYRVTRDVLPEECPWLRAPLRRDMTVYKYRGHTYGVIDQGIACSFYPDLPPFFEVPEDALEEVTP